MTKFTTLRHHKMLPTALIVATLVVLPTAASVYAQSPDDTTTETTTEQEQQTETNTTETTDKTPVVTEEPTVTQTETETETETPADPTLTAVTLAQAQAIAETEHPDSVVVASKTKTIDSQTVYAFTFADGWKVYVRASDGTVIKVQDKADKEHACQNKHKKSGVYSEDKQSHAKTQATSADWKKSVHDGSRSGSHRGQR